jgi:DNA-binding response OmpR family regulator
MKILIIEDETELAKSISEYLSGENYICEFAPLLVKQWRG